MRWINSFASFGLLFATLLLSPVAEGGQRTAASLYQSAQQAEKTLHQSERRLSNKTEWQKVARKYRAVVLAHPRSGFCDDALYYEAEIQLEIHRRFKDKASLVRALDAYLLLANGYPASKWAAKARLTRGKLFLEDEPDRKSASIELRKVTKLWPNSTEAAEARRLIQKMSQPPRAVAETLPPGVVGVRNLRHWTGREYTRIVIDLDRQVKYRQGRLSNPDRIYFDLLGTRVSEDLASREFLIEDGSLQQIRVGQNKPGVVRVVLDFENIGEYNVFSLPDPYRLVVDIQADARRRPADNPPVVAQTPGAGKDAPAAAKATEPPATKAPAPVKSADATPERRPAATAPTKTAPASAPEPVVAEAPSDIRLPATPTKDGYSVARQFGLTARRVIIDAGHGGHDPGTRSKSGLREKDLVLDISHRVANILKNENFEVLLTRDKDVYIPLEERTAIANSKDADLFVSIHANASPSSRARGTETYFLNLATTPDAEEVAARENAVTTRRLGELQNLLQKVMNNSKITESRELATQVQGAMAGGLFQSTKDSRNRGVKTAPFYVLLGAQMPSILVEVGFLSNRKDEALLKDPGFRQRLAATIAKGVSGYHATLDRTTKADAGQVAGN